MPKKTKGGGGWSDADANTWLSGKDTDDLSEGSSNKYSPLSDEAHGKQIASNLGVNTAPDATTPLKIEVDRDSSEIFKIVDENGDRSLEWWDEKKAYDYGRLLFRSALCLRGYNNTLYVRNAADSSSGAINTGNATVSTLYTNAANLCRYDSEILQKFRGVAYGGGPAERMATTTTSDATPDIMASVAIDEDEAMLIKVEVVAFDDSGLKAAEWTGRCIARRATGGNVVIADQSVSAQKTDLAAADFDFVADTGDQEIDLRFTGVAATNLKAKIIYSYMKMEN